MKETIRAICSIPSALSRDMQSWISKRKRIHRARRIAKTAPMSKYIPVIQSGIETYNHPAIRKGGE